MQNLLISGLNALIKKYRFQEKILITPSLYTGQQILQHLTRESPGWINIRPSTAGLIAEDIAEPEMIKNDTRVISRVESNIIIDSIFSDLARESKLSYFKKNIINTGIIEAITAIIAELKMSGMVFTDLDTKHFINPQKAKDIKLMYRQYEETLAEKNLIDYPELINMSLGILGKKKKEKSEAKYIVLSRYKNTPLEVELINAISGGAPIIIGEEKIYGLPEPKNSWKTDDAKSSTSCFSYLFDIENIPPDCSGTGISLSSSASYQDEVDEVLGSIMENKIPLDTVEIIYTKSSPYLSILYHTLERLGIPAAFPDGLPGDMSGPGKALKSIIMWIREDFLEIHLRRLLSNNLITTPNNRASALAHILRTSNIGWGRDRYIPVLDKAISDIKKKDDDRYIKRLNDLEALKELASALLKTFKEVKPGDIIFSRLCDACRDFLETFIKPSGPEDAGYILSLKERLELLSAVSGREMTMEEAAGRILDLVSKIPYRKSSPRPGQVLVTGISSGGRSGRVNTYMLGFDNHKFPGTANQDPILLDEERENISSGLILSEERLREKLYGLNQLLACLRGRVHLSFSAYDVKDDRSLFPSSVYLQAYRLAEKDSLVDYENMKRHIKGPEGQAPAHIIDINGWWINKLTGSSILKDGTESVYSIYPHLRQGSIAAAARKDTSLTPYDGYIGSQPGLDPRKNKDMVLSCTALESYAACPWSFFLQYILGAYRPEEVKKDPFNWLDAAQRGILLHKVFQRYSAGPGEGKKDISAILEKVLEEYRFEVPVPGKAAYENEAARLKKDLEIFMELDSQLAETQHAEFAFGYEDGNPAEIETGTGIIRLKGKIDRVDRDSGGNYHVWDYKTGSAYLFDEDGYIAGGRQLQHILYAMVLEKVLGCSVSVCGYLLPTEKARSSGKGQVFGRDPGDKERWQEGLNLVLDLMAGGLFIVSDEENPPYIDDSDIYGDSQAKKYLREKIKDPENVVLLKWKQLKDYK